MAQILIEHLTKVFLGPTGKVRAVTDLTLAVEDREFLVLVGPSGCGKTTTLRLIAGLESATAGTISIAGQVVNQLPAKARDVAMVFQNPALYPHLSVRENLAFGLRLRKYPRVEIQQRVGAMAELLDLTDCLERRPMALSGGQRQRVALGRALVRQPKLLLLDEPLSNLDLQMRCRMRREIVRLHQQSGATFIYVTHDQGEAMTLGQRIGVMRAGALQQVGPPLSVYRQPANLFVAAFLGSPPMNCFEGFLRREGEAVWFKPGTSPGFERDGALELRLDSAAAGRLNRLVGQKLILGIRPDRIVCEPMTRSPSCTVSKALVEAVELLGSETYLRLKSQAGSFLARAPEGCSVRPGEMVPIAFDLGQAHFFDPLTEESVG